jgi:hypothetical protein
MDIMNSALTSKTNHNDCERSSEAPVDFIERVHFNQHKLTAELPTTVHRGNVMFAVTQVALPIEVAGVRAGEKE